MRHRKLSKKLGRSRASRQALLAALVNGLIEEKRIQTTLAKAKAAQRLAERLVTSARTGTLAARRQAIATLRMPDRVADLFARIAPSFAERKGGYTRIVKVGRREGDGAEMALLEWVGIAPADKKKKKKPEKKEEQSK